MMNTKHAVNWLVLYISSGERPVPASARTLMQKLVRSFRIRKIDVLPAHGPVSVNECVPVVSFRCASHDKLHPNLFVRVDIERMIHVSALYGICGARPPSDRNPTMVQRHAGVSHLVVYLTKCAMAHRIARP